MLASLGPSVHNTNTDLYWPKPPGEPEGDGRAFGETADWLKFDAIQVEPLACHLTDLIMNPLQTVSVQWFERKLDSSATNGSVWQKGSSLQIP